MSSLNERIALLESDIKANPSRIKLHSNLPFAIFRYDPTEEWAVRREAKLLATRLEQSGKKTELINLSEFLWQAIDETEGMNAIVELEKDFGYLKAQDQITTYLSDQDWRPLPEMLSERLKTLEDKVKVVFLLRAASMAPGIYYMSKLLDEMHGKTNLETILFYPGSLEGTTGLRFMALKEREGLGNYRVKIYG